MRVMVTGSTGQLGRWLVRLAKASPEHDLVRACDREALDLEDREQVAQLFQGVDGGPPDVVVNAAAFTEVDRCESEPERAMRVNGEAPGELAALCQAANVRLIHVSTDFVYDGDGRVPYSESAPTGPRTRYGQSKLEGERRVLEVSEGFLVVRTSWVFGPGRNFVRTILELAERCRRGQVERPLRVVADQLGCPTYSADLAQGILALASLGIGGLVHLCNSGAASWWELARAALDERGYTDLFIERIPASDYKRAAEVPMYSVMDCSRAAKLGVSLRPWREALEAYLRSPDAPGVRDPA